MVTKNRFVILFQAVFVVIFALGLLFPAGMMASAQDVPPTETTETTVEESPPEEPPPETGTTDAETPPVEEPVAEPETGTEAIPLEEVAPVDGAVPEVLPTEDPLLIPLVPPVAAPEGSGEEEELDTPAEVIEALPADAELVVLDENGEAVPLVTVEAAETLVTGDPMWCPGTDAPDSASCIHTTTIEQAVTYAKSVGKGECTIYVAQDYTNPSNSTISIDESTFADSDFNMFLVGGYDLTTGSLTYGTVIGQTTLNQNFYIDDITGSLTLANFFIKEFTTNNPTINIEDSEDVSLVNMTVNNKGNGNAVQVDDSHDITISDSSITDKADGYGIKMTDSYAILIIRTDVKEYGEDGGIYMGNVRDVTLDDVTVDSYDYGCSGPTCSDDAIAFLDSRDVYLADVVARSRYGDGLFSYKGLGVLSLVNSVFDNNDRGHGILIVSHDGSVYLEDTSASGNDDEGAQIENDGDVVITGGIFSANEGDYGLNVEAETIGISGTLVENNENAGGRLRAEDWIEILISRFIDNADYGLNARAGGTLEITGSHFDNNGWDGHSNHFSDGYGAHLDSALDMTITDSTFNNNFNEGLYAEAGEGMGPMALEEMTVMTGGYGWPPPPPPPPPKIGNIVLDGVEASDNGMLRTNYKDAFGASVFTNGTLTILDSMFNHNTNFGLDAYAHGVIHVEGTEVYNNQGYDEDDFGARFLGDSSIELLDSSFDSNWGPGLQVDVREGIVVDGVSASDNIDWYEYCHWFYPGYGAKLFTKYNGVEISNGYFDDNEGFGLYVWADQDVVINDTSANNNTESGFWETYGYDTLSGGGPVPPAYPGWFDGDGAYIFSQQGSVEINDSFFDDNEQTGLTVESKGDITLNYVSASGNGDEGARLTSYMGDVEVTCSVFKEDGGWGLMAGAFGFEQSVTLNSPTFADNGSGDFYRWAGELVENMAYPCGPGGGGPGGGPGGGIVPPFIAGLIPVTGGEFVALNCDGISVIQLPTGEEVIFNQPMCGYMASMELVTTDDLPGNLPEGLRYVDGFTVTLMFGSDVIVTLPTGGTDTLVFPLHEDQYLGDFSILFWDVSASGGLGDWVNLGGVKEAMKWVKTHNQTGTFLLVQ